MEETKKQIENNKPAFSVYEYNMIEVSEIKNMMSDDVSDTIHRISSESVEGKFDEF